MTDEPAKKDEALLKRIRQRYRYGKDKWRRNQDEGKKNIRYVSGDPWDDEDKQARKGRPTVCPDELNQYVNQVVNTARQNPRGVKVDPAGDDATEKLAEYRENRIRAIEYACNASQVYTNGLQAAVERNIGFWKVSRIYTSDKTDEQEIVILPVQNPDAVLIDPDFKELDGSDIQWGFELDPIPLDEFELEYPDAEKTSFSAEDFGADASDWLDNKTILTCSYWEVTKTARKVGKSKRTVYERKIHQYVTNGVEILKTGAVQPGPYIPLVPVFGKELWVDYGSGAERVLLSLVSLARDPQKALAFVMSSMLENMGQLPKTPYIGYTGQFESDEAAWNTINTEFHPYVQVNPVVDEATNQVLPHPVRQALTPDFQAYSVGADICRRAIMSAMGISVLPTAAQRSNQKSGVALDKIQSQQAVGSYHLVDAYERAIRLTGRIINHWLSETDLGETARPVRLADGTHKLMKINTAEPVVEENGHDYHIPIADDMGRYQLTVTSAPSSDSQRQEGSEFVDTIVQNLHNLPIQPQQQAQLLALGIRLKQLGPLGDQMADIIAPQDQGVQQQMAQMQQQGQQMQEQMGKMQEMLQKLMLEQKGKVIEIQGKAQLAAIDHAFASSEADKDREVKLAIAEVGTKAQVTIERETMVHDLESQFHTQAHEAGLAAQDHAHAMAQQAHAQEHQQGMAEQQGQQQSQLSAQNAEQTQAQQEAAQQASEGQQE